MVPNAQNNGKVHTKSYEPLIKALFDTKENKKEINYYLINRWRYMQENITQTQSKAIAKQKIQQNTGCSTKNIKLVVTFRYKRQPEVFRPIT